MKNMSGPLVSLVIVNWNRKADLEECLQSIRHQTYKNTETIVVDNDSNDGSAAMISEKFPDVNLISMPDSSYGACETFNIGFANSKGAYIAVLDSDVVLDKAWVEKVVEEFSHDEQLGVVAGRVLHYGSSQDWAFFVYGLSTQYVNKPFYTTTFVGCSAAIRKVVLAKTKGYPKDFFLYHNEFVLGAKTVNAGYKIRYQPEVIAYHKAPLTGHPGKRAYYFSVRNWYWFIWEYYPLDLMIVHSLLLLVVSLYLGLKQSLLSTFFRAHMDAITKLFGILAHRAPLGDRELLHPPKSIRIPKKVKARFFARS